MPQEISVVLVDDDHLTLTALEDWLKHSRSLHHQFKVLGKAWLGNQAIEALKTHTPDLLILDLSLPDMNGMDVALFAATLPSPPSILLHSGYNDWLEWKDTVHSHIRGYVVKGCSIRVLKEALDNILKGNLYWDPAVYHQMHKKNIADTRQSHWNHPLSKRELDVLSLLKKGYKQAQIANELNLSTNTVKTHIKHMRKKANCKSIEDLKHKIVPTSIV